MLCTTVSGYPGIGVPMRKVPTILRELCGVFITQSAIQQDAMRRNQPEVGEDTSSCVPATPADASMASRLT